MAVLAVAWLGTLPARQAMAYVPDNRWSVTASGATGTAGTPIKLTWSFAPDGTSIPGEGLQQSHLVFRRIVQRLDHEHRPDQRPWFTYFKQAFDRWTALGGITFTYESHDNGTSLNNLGGQLGVRGDIRIGGAFVDGPSSTLAYTWLPDSGDMVVDTGETNFYSNSSNNHRQCATRSCTRWATRSDCCTSSRRPMPC